MRDRIEDFVSGVTDPSSAAYVPSAERIAVFDNDGNLWAEKPVYFQLLFAIDRVRELAPGHPEWRTTQPFQAVLENDRETLAAAGHEGIAELVAATHTGMTTDEFADSVRDWFRTARHPETGRLYTDMVYQPKLELLEYLRANGFKTYIVSGGGIEFIRVYAEEIYGIPPEQVIGSRIATEYERTPTGPVIRRKPELEFLDDKAGKPIAINTFIGRRPILASGNSDGDLQMLEWTHAGSGPTLCLLLHHTDGGREWAYDRESQVGRLDEALDAAEQNSWLVIDMASDWSRVFPPETP